jgi:hypothetical protein
VEAGFFLEESNSETRTCDCGLKADVYFEVSGKLPDRTKRPTKAIAMPTRHVGSIIVHKTTCHLGNGFGSTMGGGAPSAIALKSAAPQEMQETNFPVYELSLAC